MADVELLPLPEPVAQCTNETALALADAPRSLRNYVAALQAETEALRAEVERLRDEALLRQALEALELSPCSSKYEQDCHVCNAIAALRAAPAQQPAEPVAWMTYESKHRLSNGGNCKGAVPVHKNPSHASCVPLYTAPQPRRRLTDEELGKIINANWGVGVWQMGRAIEDAIWSKT